MPNDKVVIVGGGIAGVSSAYFVGQHGIEAIVLEAGKTSKGTDGMPSGTAGPYMPRHSKFVTGMSIAIYEQYLKFGMPAAQKFMHMSLQGRELLRSIARSLDETLIRELGSVLVYRNEDQAEVEKVADFFRRAGFPAQFEECPKAEFDTLYGFDQGKFDHGVKIKGNFNVDSERYVRMLKEASGAEFLEGYRVEHIDQEKNGVRITTNHGSMKADKVLLCTNGFYNSQHLRGLLQNYASFIACYENTGPNTPNTINFDDDYHYWSRQDGVLMVGGNEVLLGRGRLSKDGLRFTIPSEKPIQYLGQWCQETFTALRGRRANYTHFGVEARTIDGMPIVGKVAEDIYVNVGCNGIGQALLTFGASIMPALMGYARIPKELKQYPDFLSAERATLRGT